MSVKKVYVKFPRTGLGNILLHWAKAYSFTKKNNLELFKSSWWSFKPGPWLRGERQKRLYLGYFKEDSFYKKIRLCLFRVGAKIILDPVQAIETNKKTLYVFEKFHVDGDYFKEAKPYREQIKSEIYEMLTSKLKKQLESYVSPEIAIHVRRGDFKVGSFITPNDFFIDAINRIRREVNKDLKVTVFSDANDDELKDILELSNVSRAETKPDILDILLLSKSKICVLSISSTFSLWAGFLSNGIVIKHPDEWHPQIRPTLINEQMFEGELPHKDEELSELLKANLLQL